MDVNINYDKLIAEIDLAIKAIIKSIPESKDVWKSQEAIERLSVVKGMLQGYKNLEDEHAEEVGVSMFKDFLGADWEKSFDRMFEAFDE